MAADAPRPGERARIQNDAPDLDDELVDVLALEEEILAADAEAETELDAETEVDAKPTLEEDPIERAGRLCRAAQSGAIDQVFLEANEVPPGHTLEKHVGKDDEYLRDRLAQEKIESASTFTDLNKAERAVAMALRERSDQIDRWLEAQRPSRYQIRFDVGSDVGRVMSSTGAIRESSMVRVVLEKNEHHYQIKTAYVV